MNLITTMSASILGILCSVIALISDWYWTAEIGYQSEDKEWVRSVDIIEEVRLPMRVSVWIIFGVLAVVCLLSVFIYPAHRAVKKAQEAEKKNTIQEMVVPDDSTTLDKPQRGGRIGGRPNRASTSEFLSQAEKYSSQCVGLIDLLGKGLLGGIIATLIFTVSVDLAASRWVDKHGGYRV